NSNSKKKHNTTRKIYAHHTHKHAHLQELMRIQQNTSASFPQTCASTRIHAHTPKYKRIIPPNSRIYKTSCAYTKIQAHHPPKQAYARHWLRTTPTPRITSSQTSTCPTMSASTQKPKPSTP